MLIINVGRDISKNPVACSKVWKKIIVAINKSINKTPPHISLFHPNESAIKRKNVGMRCMNNAISVSITE